MLVISMRCLSEKRCYISKGDAKGPAWNLRIVPSVEGYIITCSPRKTAQAGAEPVHACFHGEETMSTTLKVNGQTHTLDVDPSTPLLYILRNDLGLQGPHFGCGLGQCGACTVIINGAAIRSCITPVSSVKSESHHARRIADQRQSCIPCNRPGLTSRCRSAASARTGKS